MSENIIELIRNINYEFSDLNLLEQALRHSSSASQKTDSNERLEFLGDSVIGLCITHYLYESFPEKMEGELTEIKSSVVSKESLAEAARDIDLEGHLCIGKGMAGRPSIPDSVLADAFEALAAAVFLDSDLDRTKQFLIEVLGSSISRAVNNTGVKNFKSQLQEYLQQNGKSIPVYKVTGESGPDHNKRFKVTVFINDKKCEEGEGVNKKEAEQEAAGKTLEKIDNNRDYLNDNW
ncbi:MAG: ribonuclease III [Planctomycetota bacterium]|jgi:ribonuclease-3